MSPKKGKISGCNLHFGGIAHYGKYHGFLVEAEF
jgi:hypothetical protein